MASQDSESYRKLARFQRCLYDYKYMCLERVLEQPGDIDYQFPENALFESRQSDLIGSTALHLAQTFKNKRIFDWLLRTGADFTIKNAKGSTALHESVRHVLDNFKDINWRHGLFQAKMKDEMSHEFAEAVLTAHVEFKITENPSDNDGISHFHVACLTDHVKAVEFFLDNGIPVDHAVNVDSPILPGYAPLHIAAICGCLDTAKVLLRHAADNTVKSAKGMTPLQCVVGRNMEVTDWMHTRDTTIFCFSELKSDIDVREKMIDLLIDEGADGENVIDDVGFSSFHAACTLKDTSLAERLLEKGVDVNQSVKMDSAVWPGYTALHFAAHFNVEMVELLVSRGADIEAKDAHGLTPFDMCVERFDVQDLHGILSSHAIWKDIKLSDGTTKLADLLFVMHNPEVMDSFLALKEIDVNLFVPLDSPLWPGYTVLHLSTIFTETSRIVDDYLYRDDVDSSDCWSMGSDRDERLCKRPRRASSCTSHIARILICLDEGADVTAKDARGSTPVHLAFHLQAYDAVSAMLDFHPDNANPMDKDHLSHLHVACHAKDASLVEALLSSGADANVSLSSTFRWHDNDSSFVNKYRSMGFKAAGSTPLHAAVRSGAEEVVSLLLDRGASVAAKDANGLTPLHSVFSQNWCHDIARKLLSSPNLTDSVFNDSLTHLHLAVFFGDAAAVGRLLDGGADIDATVNLTPNDAFEKYDQWAHQPLSFALEYAGCTALHIAMGLRPLAEMHTTCRKPDIARLLLRRGADMFVGNAVGCRVAYANLPRRYLQTRDEDVEIAFLEKDAKMQRRMLEDSGITMLHVACWKVDVEAVEALLSRGADANAQARADSPVWPRWSPMHVLMLMGANRKIDSGRIDAIVGMLLDHGADVTLVNVELETPLHLTEPGRLSAEIVSHVSYRSYADSPYAGLLLDRLKDDNANPSNISGISYFHIACLRNDLEYVSKFLQHGAEVNKPVDFFSDRYPGYTALHLALNPETTVDASSRVATVELLMKHGADVRAQDIYGNTPLHLAVKCGSPCETVLESFSSTQADLNATNLLGETAFELLLRSRNVRSEDIKYFLRHGFHINSYNPFSDEGYIGVISAHRTIITEIIDTWEEVLEIDSIGRTAIHNIVAMKNSPVENYAELIGTLMSRGCDIDRQDKQGRTALHLAVQFLNYKAVPELLKLGADVNAVDADGKTALTRCLEYYDFSIKTRSSYFGRNFVIEMVKVIAVYIHKMQLCGFNVHELNEKTLTDLPRYAKADEHDIQIYDEELEKAKNAKIGSSQLTFYDFLSDIRAWESLPITLDKKFCPEELLGLVNGRLICNEFPELLGLLRLQYRKFQNAKTQSYL